MANIKTEMKCEKCGKLQNKDKEKSNTNFSVFDCKQKCECGGKYVLYQNGKKMW